MLFTGLLGIFVNFFVSLKPILMNKVPNDAVIMGYSRMVISTSLYKNNVIPYAVLCDLTLIYYPILNVSYPDKLSIHSFRGHKRNLSGFKSLHPENLLLRDGTIYASEISSRLRSAVVAIVRGSALSTS